MRSPHRSSSDRRLRWDGLSPSACVDAVPCGNQPDADEAQYRCEQEHRFQGVQLHLPTRPDALQLTEYPFVEQADCLEFRQDGLHGLQFREDGLHRGLTVRHRSSLVLSPLCGLLEPVDALPAR